MLMAADDRHDENDVSVRHGATIPASPRARRGTPFALALCLATIAASPASAQEGWTYTATVSGWLAGLKADVTTPFGEVQTELDFADVWDALDMAAFASIEARNGRWAIVGDLVFADLTSDQETPFGALFSSAEVDTRLALVSGYVAYSALDEPGRRLDVGAGLRFSDASLDVTLVGNLAPTTGLSFSESWVDPIIGVRARFDIAGNWFANGYADVGGFGIGDGSDLTWQGYVGVGYRFNDTWAMQAGYRHLEIRRTFVRSDVDLAVSGAIIGIQASF